MENLFASSVTEADAPYYRDIVFRPMDLNSNLRILGDELMFNMPLLSIAWWTDKYIKPRSILNLP